MESCKVTKEMQIAGANIASDLIDASVSKSMCGLGGSKTWEEYKGNFTGANFDLIEQYVENSIDSVTAIYISQCRGLHIIRKPNNCFNPTNARLSKRVACIICA